tara:strand:- start:399 stop:2081 length:1683 start_codon:yes stop_codon:yes gene_type:complete
MPQVFSPGEPETRPLDPDALVYTTPQKVADLLEIGPQEPVLMSANAEANAVFVTGADYRNIGFSVGDTLLLYSDADPLGVDRDITAITTSAGGVKLAFSSAINPGLYETTDNGYVQNKASFTNGRNRGLTYDKVKQLILRAQDRIDNTTHNSWRPNLVSAEYINFDTYKPYRRRYYTDYVGTTPLLFRNVQQLLRVELWQGDDYREIGAAEARLKFAKNTTSLSRTGGGTMQNTATVYIANGSGVYAKLESVSLGAVGAVTHDNAKFRLDLDNMSNAQTLADLINKEDRVSASAVEFIDNGGTKFIMPGSTSNVAVHNEFLASANADYGSGIVKISSMRDSVGGEDSTIAVVDNPDTNIEVSQTHTETTTTVSSTGDISAGTMNITVASTEGFAPSGLLMGSSIGDVVFYEGKSGNVFINCKQIGGFGGGGGTALSSADATMTQHRFAIDLQGGASSGDKGRLRDFWMDSEMGIIYFNNSYPFFEWNAVKVAYIYGERYVEQAIEDVCTKMVAIELLMSDDRSVLIPEGTQNVDLASKIQLYRQDIDRTLPRYIEVITFE